MIIGSAHKTHVENKERWCVIEGKAGITKWWTHNYKNLEIVVFETAAGG